MITSMMNFPLTISTYANSSSIVHNVKIDIYMWISEDNENTCNTQNLFSSNGQEAKLKNPV